MMTGLEGGESREGGEELGMLPSSAATGGEAGVGGTAEEIVGADVASEGMGAGEEELAEGGGC